MIGDKLISRPSWASDNAVHTITRETKTMWIMSNYRCYKSSLQYGDNYYRIPNDGECESVQLKNDCQDLMLKIKQGKFHASEILKSALETVVNMKDISNEEN